MKNTATLSGPRIATLSLALDTIWCEFIEAFHAITNDPESPAWMSEYNNRYHGFFKESALSFLQSGIPLDLIEDATKKVLAMPNIKPIHAQAACETLALLDIDKEHTTHASPIPLSTPREYVTRIPYFTQPPNAKPLLLLKQLRALWPELSEVLEQNCWGIAESHARINQRIKSGKINEESGGLEFYRRLNLELIPCEDLILVLETLEASVKLSEAKQVVVNEMRELLNETIKNGTHNEPYHSQPWTLPAETKQAPSPEPNPNPMASGVTLSAFKEAYLKKRESTFLLFKKFWNDDMVEMLDNPETTIDDINAYAKRKPDSRTAAILTELRNQLEKQNDFEMREVVRRPPQR